MKQQFPGLFSNEFSLQVRHKSTAHVTFQGFPYTTPKAFFASGFRREAIRQYVQQSLENGLLTQIFLAELVALSPVFDLPQSGGKVRIIADLRKVNQFLQYTPRPTPTTESILSDLSHKTFFFLAIDIRKAYQQLPLVGDQLGIITEFGSYCFTRLPFGLASAPYWWGELLQDILNQLPSFENTIVRYYYDDILIASSDTQEHHQVIQELFMLLAKNGLSISEEKIQLAQSSILFLGYQISHNRVEIEPVKISTIAAWQLPVTKEGITKFIGFVNYLRHFIPNTSRLLAPFYKLSDTKQFAHLPDVDTIKKNTLTSFERIKLWIHRTIKLKLFDPQTPTYIFADASLFRAASVLFQSGLRNGKPVGFPLAFFSLRFTETRQRCSTVERELFAVLHTLHQARLMLSPSITVYTDNQGIISVGNTSRYTHPRFAKFLDLLNVYRLKWRYIPGNKNVLADYLSRYALDSQPELDLAQWDALATDVPIEQIDFHATEVTHNIPSTEFYGNTSTSLRILPDSTLHTAPPFEFSDLQAAHSADEPSTPIPPDTADIPIKKLENISWPDLLLIKELLDQKSSEISVRLSIVFQFFHLFDDILYILQNHRLHRIIIDAYYLKLGTQLHEKYHCTHLVLRLMIQDLLLWNPNASLLSLDIVRHCHQCEIYQTFHDLPPELPKLKPTPIFSRWHLDFAGPLPSSNGYQHLLIAADYTSNLILVAPTTSQNTKVILKMVLRICGTFGNPTIIITDNGSPFNNPTVHDFADKAKFQLTHSSAYYQRGNLKVNIVFNLSRP